MTQSTWTYRGQELGDQEIVAAILERDALVTKEFLYRKCYPLFCSVYNKYYTDCQSPVELINEIYVYILTPKRDTGRCKLADFGFRCSLAMWLKIVTEHFCHQLYTRRVEANENFSVDSDRNNIEEGSFDADFNTLNMEDVRRILQMMPNDRYRRLIQHRYLEEKSNEETANLLSLSMDNYYNVHLRAKNQFCNALKKEGLI